MSFDRSKLDSFGFVLPVEKESHRGQIPRTFYRFAKASHPVKIQQKGGRNIVISQVDLIGVYSILRSMPPSHRWKGDTVKAAIVGGRDGMGGNKVDAILSYLHKEGWIRHVELPKLGGQHGGSIIEVQYRRLPKSEVGKKRWIKSVPGRGWVMFEDDRVTEVKDAESRRRFLVPDKDREHPYGRDDEDNESNWLPYTRPSGERSSEERSSEEPEPRERSAGEEYKDHDDKDHAVECTPIVPQAEPGESESFGSESRERDEKSDAALTADNAAAARKTDPSPGKTSEVEMLVAKLERLGKAASRSPGDRTKYEVFLARELLPRLGDPPSPSTWKTPATRKWGEQSLKAQIILTLSCDERWPDSLLRSFGKHCGMYSADILMVVLLNFDWNSRRSTSLETLIQNGRRSWNMSGWNSFTSNVCNSNQMMRINIEYDFTVLQLEEGESDLDLAGKWQQRAGEDSNPFLRGQPNPDDVFTWLYQIWRAGAQDSAASIEGAFAEVQDQYRDQLMSFVASSRRHLAIASANHQSAGEIWGVNWGEVRKLHAEKVEALNLRAEIFGLDPIEPLFELIDHPLQIEAPSTSGDSAWSIAPEPSDQEPDFCSPACTPLGKTSSPKKGADLESSSGAEFSAENIMQQFSEILIGKKP